MAKQDITTSFKVDISDLKRNITEANRQIQLANSAFREASSAMDDWGNSSDGVNAKLKQLYAVLGQQETKLQSYYAQQKALNDASEENGRRADELRAKLVQLGEQGVDKTSTEYKKLVKALTDCEKEQIANKAAAEKLDATISNQKATINGLNKDITTYKDVIGKLDDETAKVSASTAALKVDMTGFESALSDADRSITDANNQFKLAASTMDDWKGSTDGITSKLTQLVKVLDQQKSKVSIYENEIRTLEDAYADNGKRIETLQAQVKEFNDRGLNQSSLRYKTLIASIEACTAEQEQQKAAIDKAKNAMLQEQIAVNGTEKEIRTYKSSLNDLNKAHSDSVKAANEQATAYNKLKSKIAEQEDTLASLKNEYKKLALTQDTNTDEAEELRAAITALSNSLNDNRAKLKEADQAADQFDKSLDDLSDSADLADDAMANLNDGFTVMKGVLSNLVTDGIRRAGEAIKGFITDSVNLSKDLYEVQNVVDVTFGEGAKTIDNWAETAGNAYGMTKLAAKQYTGTLGALIKSTGVADENLVEMSTNLVAMAGDFASFYNLDHSEAFEKIRAGIAGETEPLRQLGINLTVANMETYALQQGLGKTWKEMSYAEQTMLRYNYILDKGSLASGDFVRTQDSLANQLRLAQLNIDNVKIAMGERLVPVVNRAVTTFNSWLKTLDMDKVAENTDKALDVIIGGFRWFVDNKDAVITAVKLMISAFAVNKVLTFGNAIVGLGKQVYAAGVTGQWYSTVTKAMTAAQAANTTAMNAGTVATNLFNAAWKANPIGIATVAIVGITAAVVALSNKLTETDAETQKVIDATEQLKEDYDDTTKSIEQNNNARQQAIDDANTEAGTLNFLMGKIEKLAGVEDKSNDQKAEMSRLVSELNEKMPELNLKYDDEKDKLNLSTQAIKENIEAQKQLIIAKAMEGNLTTIAEDIADVELKRSEALKQLKTNTDAYNQSVKENGAVYEEYQKLLRTSPTTADDFYWANRKVIDSQTELKKSVEDSKGVIDGYESDLKELNDTYTSTGQLADEWMAKADLSGKLAQLNGQLEQAGRTMPESIAKGINDGKYAVPASIEELDRLISFESSLQKAGLSGKEIPQYLYNGVMDGSILLVDAMSEINDLLEIPDKATELYNQGAAIPKNFAQGVKDGKYTLEEAQYVLDTAINWDSIIAKAKEQGAIIPTGLAESIRNGKVTVEEARKQVEDSVTFAKLVEDAGFVGTDITDSLANSIINGTITPAQAVEQMRSQVVNHLNEMVSDAGLKGVEIPTALSNSIMSGEMTVEQATSAMNNWIDFNSAIQETNDSGVEIPSLLANSILNGKTDVDSAVSQMNNWINFQKAINKAGLEGLEIPNSLAEKIYSGKPLTEDAANQLIDAISGQIEDGSLPWEDLGVDSIAGYVQSLADGNEDVGTAAKDAINAGIDAAKDAQQSNSPSKVYAGLGTDAVDGYAQGINESQETVKSAVAKMIENSFTGSNGLVGNMKTLGQQAGQSYATGIKATSGSVQSAGNAIKTSLTKAATGSLAAVGKKAGSTFASGVKSTTGSAQSAGSAIKSSLTKGATGSLLTVGKNAGTTFASGVRSTTGAAKSAGTSLKNAITTSVKTNLTSLGKSAGDGFAKGITSTKNAATNAGKTLKNSLLNGADGGYSPMYDEGRNAAEGFRQGILSKAQSIANAAASVVRKAITAAKNAQKSASPSKIWKNEIGAMAGEGYIVGLADMIKPAVSEAKALVTESIGAAKSQLAKSNIGSVSGAKSNLLGVMGNSGSGAGLTNNTTNKTMNFTQIINAPKAPSRIELYRQTRNLLNYSQVQGG